MMRKLEAVLCVVAVLASFAFVACENEDSSEKPYGIFFAYDGEKYAFQEGLSDADYDVKPFGYWTGEVTFIAATSDCAATFEEADDCFLFPFLGDGAGEDETFKFDLKIDGVYNDAIDTLTIKVTGYGEVDGDITGSVEGFDGATSVLDGTFKVHRLGDKLPE